MGLHAVFAAVTGPGEGLTAVNQHQRHLSTNDPDVDYIDILEQQNEHESNHSGKCNLLLSYLICGCLNLPSEASYHII